MATHKQSKILVDRAADNSSSHELSFASFLSIQDMQPKRVPIKPTYNIKHQEQDFEFSSVTQHPKGLGSGKGCPSDMSICRGQIQLRTLLYQSTQFQVASKPATHCNNEAPNTYSNADDRKVAQKSNYGRKEKRKDRAPRPSFAQKMLQSFVSPCRECHAHKPSVREHSITQKQSKLNGLHS